MTSEIQEDSEMMRSFSNPNYLPNVADALNSNLPDYYHDNHVYEDVIDSTDGDTNATSKTNASSKRRKKYGQIDMNSMGVSEIPDLSSPDDSMYSTIPAQDSCTSPMERTGAIVEVEHTEEGEPGDEGDDGTYAQVQSKGFLGYYASLEQTAKAQLMENDSDSETEAPQVPPKGGQEAVPLLALEKHKQRLASRAFDEKMKDINSPDSNDSGIQADVHHIQAPGSDEIYAVVNKPKKADKTDQKSPEAVREKTGPEEDHEGPHETEPSLPSGWECYTDEDGPYYWHIKSGTIQREPPSATDGKESCRPNSMISECSRSSVSSLGDLTSTSSTEPHSESLGHDFSSQSDEKAPDVPESAQDSDEKPIRFAVRSLGWVRIEEEDLTPERSSKAVNRCIVDLSLGRNDINDVVGRWGDGKDLYMDLDNQNLTLIDPQDMSVLNVQSIQSIRVWGVGRDNGRDFAYVARDRTTRKHMCHVFRCDTPARQIANTLRDICKRIMLERSLAATSSRVGRMAISRPTDLPNLEKTTEAGEQLTFQNLYKNTSFPTPMEEPKKLIRCHYLGTANVTRPTGVEILNSASEKVYAQVPPEKWVFVNVAVAPSTITITEYGNSDNVLAECRVRFLSFMGIAMRNVKLCSFIMHSAQDSFIAHVFHCEPSAGALCKTIEAACKLRYQKCLDAHQRKAAAEGRSLQQELPQTGLPATTGNTKSIQAQLKAGAQNVFGMLKKTAKGLKNDSTQGKDAAS